MGNLIFLGDIEWGSSLVVIQISIMGSSLIIPIQKLFGYSYLGTVESQICTLTYDEAQPNFFFDYFNLNPLEDLENKKKNFEEGVVTMGAKSEGKIIEMLEFQKNQLISGNIFLKAL